MRTVLLSLHVAGGVAGLALGAFALSPFRAEWIRRAYAGSLLVLALFLAATVVVDWSGLAAPQQVIYAALVGLAIVIVLRAYLAVQTGRRRGDQWQTSYVNHIYFTYVSLWEGLAIVGLIDLRAPGWAVAAVAVGILALGAALISAYKRRLPGRISPA